MECAIDVYVGDGDGFEEKFHRRTTARRDYRCKECGCKIVAGSEFVVEGIIDHVKRTRVYRTCLDCMSVIEHLFCSYFIGGIWGAMKTRIADDPDFVIPESGIAKLTPKAREKVCELIEGYWED